MRCVAHQNRSLVIGSEGLLARPLNPITLHLRAGNKPVVTHYYCLVWSSSTLPKPKRFKTMDQNKASLSCFYWVLWLQKQGNN